ncbi:MAG TPA: type II toxin-antitoxin system RelE/ParE family toxin [Hyphomicrobiaceae bacterium]|nr:type II toxin-antitoxin system RelE/ParE family toxin [Hyphomicrobiaceae bacterium]
MPIRSFRHRGLKRLFERDQVRGIPPSFVDKLRDMLAVIDAAETVEDIGVFPGWRLHPLKGELAGFWSLTVSGNWRLIFRFENNDAFDLELVDYH